MGHKYENMSMNAKSNRGFDIPLLTSKERVIATNKAVEITDTVVPHAVPNKWLLVMIAG